ncbi:MAG: hypothetical protein CSA62_06710 [Planctomycetota bacterium]|nr:MAG: hypothetical protein CSA62_06710 [Planctomycetota bacterium]
MNQISRLCRRRRCREGGFTFAEMAFAFLILVTISLALLNHTSITYRRNAIEKDKVFAYSKATSILAELQSYVNRTEDAAANSLDVFDDGSSYNRCLTITEEAGPLAPDHPLSGNVKQQGEWVWARRISVKPFAGLNNRNVRYVTVKVFKRVRESGSWMTLADLSGVVNSVASSFPPSQEFDVYLLALENIPGWWVHMDSIRPFLEATITDLEARNPGAKIRTHWITKASYGRNQLYTPWINESNDSSYDIPGVYFYPGKMPSGSASTYYYVPEAIGARMWLDGVKVGHYDSGTNPYPYALADSWNHAMRLPQERAYFAKRVAAGLEDPDTPTWRLLLEDMATNPAKYHNAILVNLHGELLPMPALRNYSDPAKSPHAMTGVPGLRVVTHPEHLRYVRGPTAASSEAVKLRVYAYWDNPSLATDEFCAGRPIAIQIMNVNLTGNINGVGAGATTLKVQRLPGGVDRGDGNDSYSPFELAPTVSTLSSEMYFEASFVDNTSTGGEKYTLLLLHNTPSVAPLIGTSPNVSGLSPDYRLYGMDYIPCACETANDFSVNLATFGEAKSKNTARWLIEIPNDVLNGASTGSLLSEGTDYRLEVRTRLGTDLNTGTVYPTPNDPDNLSTTYTWWVDDLGDVPITERSQFLGDPRHCPYADLKHGGASFPNGYNWYFDDFVNGSQDGRARWPGFSSARLRDRWKGRTEVDFPRYAQLLREAVVNSEAVYTTLTGWSYYYMGIGNEIGYDSANGYPSSIPVNLRPYGLNGNSYVDNIASGGDSTYRYQKIVRERAASADYWWGKHWLGELYPDREYNHWLSTGNLNAGPAANFFMRTSRYNIVSNLPYGTRLANSIRRTQCEGCTSVFNIGSTNSTFHHRSRGNTYGGLVGPGLELASNYNFPLPTTTKISRPFSIATSWAGGRGDEWNFTAEYPRFRATVERRYYRHQDGIEGSSLVGLTRPDGLRTGRIVVSGLDRTVESGSSFIAKFSVLALMHSFFEAGNTTMVNPITLPPRIKITDPTEITELDDPVTITISWNTAWKRWDGSKYAGSFGAGFALNEADLRYVVMYSADNGTTWHHVQDGSAATIGRLPSNSSYILWDTGVGDESYVWNVPSGSFPEASYLIRVECYRGNEALHYSHHQAKIYIQR